ncbi:AlbA family DNA-binding domain-containing protein [Streptomyces narbonensis]|uniref:AlbA family DNA-binding domain-containing protein n=1 Tax=Streptomyces narbonensis TaxID=67333 RepID=UPI00340AF57B
MGRADLWRIVRPPRAGWFPQITIGPDVLTAVVEGEALDDVVLELNWAAGNQSQPVDGAGTYCFELPNGLVHDSLLMLRREDRWLDWRSFLAPTYGRARDTSVVWEQPGLELDILLANGEGPHLECKREVPEGESRKKMLKTIAAFASKDRGTILIGVQDDLQIVGLPEQANVDKQSLQIVNMIRDTLEPVSPYESRVIDHEGRKVLAIEVSSGGQMHAYRNGQRLEFYVRVGPNTVPARHHEIAAGFQQDPTASIF